MNLTRTNWSFFIKCAALIVIGFFVSITFGQIVSAHGGEVGEVSENLVEITPASGENYHIEFKAETLEGYRIPELDITATITSVETGESSTMSMHAMFGGNYHYGSNIALPEGEYTFSFHVDPPTFIREGSRANSWLDPAEALFTFSAVDDPQEATLVGEKVVGDMKLIFEMETAESMWAFPEDMDEHMDGDAMPSGQDTQDGMNRGLLAVLSLLIGAGLGFFFGKSKKTSMNTPENNQSSENQG